MQLIVDNPKQQLIKNLKLDESRRNFRSNFPLTPDLSKKKVKKQKTYIVNIIFCFAPKQATPFARNKAKTLCSSDEIASKEGLKRGIKINARDQRLTRMFDIHYYQRKYK